MPVKFENASITNQVVLITAGAAGIGRILAEKFLSHGCSVHVCDIDRAAIDDFLSDNPGASASVADVAKVSEVEAMFDDLVELYGRLDILINNAGIAGPVANLEDILPEDWDRTIAVDLSGQFYVTRLAVPMMKKAGSGSIINISSTAALFGCPMRSRYSASKWAIIGLTKTLAMELGPWDIRVNAICPGSVEGGASLGSLKALPGSVVNLAKKSAQLINARLHCADLFRLTKSPTWRSFWPRIYVGVFRVRR